MDQENYEGPFILKAELAHTQNEDEPQPIFVSKKGYHFEIWLCGLPIPFPKRKFSSTASHSGHVRTSKYICVNLTYMTNPGSVGISFG